MKPIHVLILPSNYPDSQNDISVSFFREQVLSLKEHILNVGVIHIKLFSFLNFSKLRLLPDFNYESDNGINTFRITYIKLVVFSEYFKIKLIKCLGLFYFKKYIKIYGKPDVIHCHNFHYAAYISELIFDRYQIPFVITEHDSRFFTNNLKFNLKDISRIANKASLCLAVSSKFCDLLTHKIPNSPFWHVHHNIVSKIFFEENMNLSKKDAFVFISIGRLIKHKNVDLVLKSFKIFNDKYPSSILKIVGDGPEMNFLKDEVFKLKITNNVVFLGELSRREVVDELKHSHIFVSGSIYETFGVVFIEALAQGLPVLSTPCEGVFDIVNDQNGIIISSITPSDMSKAMFLIFDNFDNFNKRQIIDECQFKFSEETQSKRLIEYYQKVIN